MDSQAGLKAPVAREIVFIFLFALVLRLAFLAFYDTRPRKDAVSMDRIAWSMAQGQGYVWPDGSPAAHRPPVYPFFLSLIYRLFGHDYAIVKIAQCLIGAATCVLIYLISRVIFDERAALTAGLLAAMHISFIAVCRLLLSENAALFILACAILCLISGLKRDSVRLFIVSGFLLGLLALTNSIMSLFAPAAAAAIALYGKREISSQRLVAALAVILTAVITIAPWTARNYMVFKRFVPLTTQMGESLYASYVPKDGRIFGMMPRNDPVVDYAAENFEKPQRSRFMTGQAFKYIRENPARVLKMLPLKAMFFLSPFDWEILSGRGLYNFSYCFLLPFFILGLRKAGLRTIETLILALPFFYLAAMSLFLYGSPRFRLSGEIVMTVFASYAIAALFSKARGFKKPFFVLSAWAAANAALFVFSDNLKYLLKTILEGVGLW